MKLKEAYEKAKSLPWPAWAAIYTLEIWLINFIAPGSLGWAPDDIGSFGDMFGAANSIFSAFAVVGVAWSISMQRTELSIARRDRIEATEILKEQQDNLKLQRFETTFFQLLTAFQNIIKDMEVANAAGRSVSFKVNDSTTISRNRPTSLHGQRAIERILSSLEENYTSQEDWLRKKDPEGLESGEDWIENLTSKSIDAFGRAYHSLFAEYGSSLGRYFRSLYIILNLVEQSDIPEVRKPFYTKLIRAQLSQEESTLLALNYLSPHTTPAFNALKVKYGMAKNSNRGNEILHSLINELPPQLFGRTYAKYRAKTGG